MPPRNLESAACTPVPLDPAGFNPNAVIPFGCTMHNIRSAMQEFIDFLGFVNTQLNSRSIPRLESMLMPANFSSIVGEFMRTTIPRHCRGLVKNRYHNGHPDLIPANCFENDMCQHGNQGVEIKGSRYLKAWQGHNPEDTWLMVFVFDSNRPWTKGEASAQGRSGSEWSLGRNSRRKTGSLLAGRRQAEGQSPRVSQTPAFRR